MAIDTAIDVIDELPDKYRIYQCAFVRNYDGNDHSQSLSANSNGAAPVAAGCQYSLDNIVAQVGVFERKMIEAVPLAPD